MSEMNRQEILNETNAWLRRSIKDDPATVRRMVGLDVFNKLAGFLIEEKRIPITITSIGEAERVAHFLTERYKGEVRCREKGDEFEVSYTIPSDKPELMAIEFRKNGSGKRALYFWSMDCVYLRDANGIDVKEVTSLTKCPFGIVWRYFTKE